MYHILLIINSYDVTIAECTYKEDEVIVIKRNFLLKSKNSILLYQRVLSLAVIISIFFIIFYGIAARNILNEAYTNQTFLLKEYNSKLTDYITTIENTLQDSSINPILINAAYKQNTKSQHFSSNNIVKENRQNIYYNTYLFDEVSNQTTNNNQDKIRNMIILKELNDIAHSSDFIDSVYFITTYNHLIYSSLGNIVSKEDQFFDITWISKFTRNITGIQYIDTPRRVNSPLGESFEYVSVACPVPSLSQANRGILIFNFTTQNLYNHIFSTRNVDLLENYAFNSKGEMVLGITNSNVSFQLGKAVYSSSITNQETDHSILDFNSEKYIVSQTLNNLLNWKLFISMPRKYYLETLFPSTIVFLILVSFTLISILYISFLIARATFKPIDKIVEKFHTEWNNVPIHDDQFKYIEQVHNSLQQYDRQIMSTINAYSDVIYTKIILQIINNSDISIEQQNEFENTLSLLKHAQVLEHICVGVVKLDLSHEFKMNLNNEPYYKFQKSMAKKLTDITNESFNSLWVWSDPKTLVGILHVNDTHSVKLVNAGLTELGGQLEIACKENNNVSVYIAFGNVEKNIRFLHRSFSEAHELLSYKMLNKQSSPYCYNLFVKSEVTLAYNKLQVISQYIKLGKSLEACNLLESYFSIIYLNPELNIEYIMDIAKELINLIYDAISGIDIVSTELLSNKNLMYNRLADLSNVDEIAQYILNLTKDACEKSKFNNDSKKEMRMQNLLEWVDHNYNIDISLDMIADRIGCSTAYASKLFKAHTGTNIITYINNLRITHAKQLLLATNMTLLEIGSYTGFNNQQSFIRCFKRHVNMTPSEFKTVNSVS